MSSPQSSSAILDQLLESFLERQRRGERPSIDEYVREHPALAEEIRDVFPAAALIEQFGSAGDSGDDQEAQGETPSAAPMPTRLGEYCILREVGRGGMGVVYEALQESLGRHVALKVLPPHAKANATFLERFRREAQAAARLHHSNIVPVFAVGEHEGIAFYAMQYICGHTLESVLSELRRFRAGVPLADRAQAATVAYLSEPARSLLTTRFELGAANEANAIDTETPNATRPAANASQTSIERSQCGEPRYFRNVAELGVQIGEALAYAHGQGLVHRDIKPSNLMLDARGTVWITDFGLAKTDESSDLTNPGEIVGTLRYMAPEQLDGKADARSDLYALGITLYELATLRPAFEDPLRARLFDQIRSQDPPRPRQLEPRVPRDLETILLKAIAKEPHRRYQTAAELVEDLRRFLADRPVLARRTSWMEHSWKWCRRNSGVASLLASIAMLLVSVTAGSVIAALFFQEAKDQAEKNEDRAKVAETDAREKLWHAKLEEANALTMMRRPGQRVAAMEALKGALVIAKKTGWTEDDRRRFRNVAIACLTLPDVVEEKVWKGLPPNAGWGHHWSVDANLATYVRPDGRDVVGVYEVKSGRRVAKIPVSLFPNRVALSPDGQFVAISRPGTSEGELSVWRVNDGGEATQVYEGRGFRFVDFRADSKKFTYFDANRNFQIVDLGTLKRKSYSGFTLGDGSVLLSPDGRWVAYSRAIKGKQSLVVGDLDKNLSGITLPQHLENNWIAWHPSSRILAYANEDKKIHLLDVEKKRDIALLSGHEAYGMVFAFDSSGRTLLSNDWNNLLRIWDVDSGAQQLVLPAYGPVIGVGNKPGEFVVQSADGNEELRHLRVLPGAEMRKWPAGPRTGSPNWIETPTALDKDSRLLAHTFGSSVSAGIAILDTATGDTLGRLNIQGCYHIRFDANGALLTSGVLGVCRWPRSEEEGQIAFGPPQTLYGEVANNIAASDRAGEVFAFPRLLNGFLMIPRQGHELAIRRAGAVTDVRNVDVSPDGKWVVTGDSAENADGVRIWDVEAGKLVKEFPTSVFRGARFSPDGKWFWSCGGNGQIYRVGAWEPGPKVGGHAMAISPDSAIVAVGVGVDSIRIVNMENGAELARLRTGEHELLAPDTFSHDGARLYAWGKLSRAYYAWDLRLLRSQLADLGLDWTTPSLPPAIATPAPTSVVFRMGPALENLAAGRALRSKKNADAIEAWKQSLEIDPKQPDVYRQWARLRSRTTTNPRGQDEALKIAERALELDGSWRNLHLRGDIHVARKDFPKALADYERALELNGQASAVYWSRAECYEKMNELPRAIADMSRVIELLPDSMEAHRLRANYAAAAGKGQQAARDLRRCLVLQPNQPALTLMLARLLVLGPPDARGPEEAMELVAPLLKKRIQFGIVLAHPEAVLIEGVAHYRLGNDEKAIHAFSRLPAQQANTLRALDHLFLAAANHRLGQRGLAKVHFDNALTNRQELKLTDVQAREFDALSAEIQKILKQP